MKLRPRDKFTLSTFVNVRDPKPLLEKSPAARHAQLMGLYRPAICDENGNFLRYAEDGEGLITREQFLKLMGEP